jgi:hypothetical protein
MYLLQQQFSTAFCLVLVAAYMLLQQFSTAFGLVLLLKPVFDAMPLLSPVLNTKHTQAALNTSTARMPKHGLCNQILAHANFGACAHTQLRQIKLTTLLDR